MKKYNLVINGNKYEVAIEGVEGSKASVNVNGVDYEVEIEGDGVIPAVVAAGEAVTHTVSQSDAEKTAASVKSEAGIAAGGTKVTSPLPGVIIEVSVKEGQAVKAGQKVAVLEAMKMENEIAAPRDGVIAEIHVQKGDSLLEGAPVVTIA